MGRPGALGVAVAGAAVPFGAGVPIGGAALSGAGDGVFEGTGVGSYAGSFTNRSMSSTLKLPISQTVLSSGCFA